MVGDNGFGMRDSLIACFLVVAHQLEKNSFALLNSERIQVEKMSSVSCKNKISRLISNRAETLFLALSKNIVEV